MRARQRLLDGGGGACFVSVVLTTFPRWLDSTLETQLHPAVSFCGTHTSQSWGHDTSMETGHRTELLGDPGFPCPAPRSLGFLQECRLVAGPPLQVSSCRT